jgi:hypothetical protein
MIKIPDIPNEAGLPLPEMHLAEYAHFSESCLLNNPSVTPDNCLTTRAEDVAITARFSMNPAKQKK